MAIVLILVKGQHGRHCVLVGTDVGHCVGDRGCVIRTRYAIFRANVGAMFMTDWASVCNLACRVSRVHLHVGFKLVHTAAWFG